MDKQETKERLAWQRHWKNLTPQEQAIYIDHYKEDAISYIKGLEKKLNRLVDLGFMAPEDRRKWHKALFDLKKELEEDL